MTGARLSQQSAPAEGHSVDTPWCQDESRCPLPCRVPSHPSQCLSEGRHHPACEGTDTAGHCRRPAIPQGVPSANPVRVVPLTNGVFIQHVAGEAMESTGQKQRDFLTPKRVQALPHCGSPAGMAEVAATPGKIPQSCVSPPSVSRYQATTLLCTLTSQWGSLEPDLGRGWGCPGSGPTRESPPSWGTSNIDSEAPAPGVRCAARSQPGPAADTRMVSGVEDEGRKEVRGTPMGDPSPRRGHAEHNWGDSSRSWGVCG